MAELAVILVNFRRTDDTIACVASLGLSTYRDFIVLVVDNGSGPEAVQRLRMGCPDAVVLDNGANLGFAEGNNVGIREARARGASLYLLLNNDTVVDSGALGTLVETAHTHPGAGIIGAKILYYDPPHLVWFAGGYLNPDSGFGGHLGVGMPDRAEDHAVRQSDFISGCCLMLGRDVVERVGMLQTQYFAYYEDADLCMRARRAGYAILYQPSAVIYHRVSSTSGWDSPVYLYFNLRNRILFLRWNSTFRRWLPFLPRLIWFYLRQFIRLAFKWRNWPGVHAAWWGVWDGLRGYTGIKGEGSLSRLLSLAENSGGSGVSRGPGKGTGVAK